MRSRNCGFYLSRRVYVVTPSRGARTTASNGRRSFLVTKPKNNFYLALNKSKKERQNLKLHTKINPNVQKKRDIEQRPSDHVFSQLQREHYAINIK